MTVPAARTTHRWVVRAAPRLRPQVRLVCIPFAGGSSSLFSEWHRCLPHAVEVCALELPGRRRRMGEPPLRSMETLVTEAASAAEPYLDVPIALFGHCTGALIAFELARELERRGVAVTRLFPCCAGAPQLPNPDPPVYQLSDAEIVAELERGGGIPNELMDHPDLLALLLATLRADCELVERHAYEPGPPLRAPISAFGGIEDRAVAPELIDGWRDQTEGPFSLRMIEGAHYLLDTGRVVLTEAIAEDLTV